MFVYHNTYLDLIKYQVICLQPFYYEEPISCDNCHDTSLTDSCADVFTFTVCSHFKKSEQAWEDTFRSCIECLDSMIGFHLLSHMVDLNDLAGCFIDKQCDFCHMIHDECVMIRYIRPFTRDILWLIACYRCAIKKNN